MTDEVKVMLDEGRAFDAQARTALVGHVLGEHEGELTTRDLEELADFLLSEDLRERWKSDGQHFHTDEQFDRRRVKRKDQRYTVSYDEKTS